MRLFQRLCRRSLGSQSEMETDTLDRKSGPRLFGGCRADGAAVSACRGLIMRLAINRNQHGRCRGVSGWVGARARARTAGTQAPEQVACAPDQTRRTSKRWSANKPRRKSDRKSARVCRRRARAAGVRRCWEGRRERKWSLRRPAELKTRRIRTWGKERRDQCGRRRDYMRRRPTAGSQERSGVLAEKKGVA